MKLQRLPSLEEALPGREQAMPIPRVHAVLDTPLPPHCPSGVEMAMFGMGCFWGAEKKFWLLPGVYSTAVGYAAGITPNPIYEEVCSGLTGHNEVVLLAFDSARLSYESLLKTFWEGHNPTMGMRQGNDIGSQYRSGIYVFSEAQQLAAERSLQCYQQQLDAAGAAPITTEILPAGAFYHAEPYHQQYLAKNPGGYCPDISYRAYGLPAYPA